MSDPSAESRSGNQFTPIGVIFVGTLLMVIAIVENLAALPWAPFYAVYAGLATMLPIIWRSVYFGPLRAIKWWYWIIAALLPLLMQSIVGTVLLQGYPALLSAMGVEKAVQGTAYYNYNAMFTAMIGAAAAKWGVTPQAMLFMYVGFIVLWAGFGEEVFYRGYMHTALRARIGVIAATIISALFFGARHYAQMVLLWPDYPWAAATAWVFVGFLLGIAMSILYEKSKSLYPPVVAHYLFNAIPLATMLGGDS